MFPYWNGVLWMCSLILVPNFTFGIASHSTTTCSLKDFSRLLPDLEVFFETKCFCPPVKFFSLDIWRLQKITATRRRQPVVTRNSCSSSNQVLGSLHAWLLFCLFIKHLHLEISILLLIFFLKLLMTLCHDVHSKRWVVICTTLTLFKLCE